MNEPRRLGPFSSYCSIWLAESAVLSPLPRPAVIDGQGRRVNWTPHGDWRRASAVVQGHTPREIWLKWRRYDWSSVCYRHGAGWMQRPNPRHPDGSLRLRTLVVVFGRYTDSLRADMGVRVIHRSTDFYTVQQKSKVGLRTIFDGVLYSKFYGSCFTKFMHLC